MRIHEFMTRDPVLVTPEDSLLHARALMKRHNIRHLPVVRDGRLEGIVSDRDVRDYVPSQWRDRTLRELDHMLERLCVDEIMSRRPVCVGAETPVAQAARLMRERGIDALPVVEDGRLIGIFTTKDALRILAKQVPDALM